MRERLQTAPHDVPEPVRSLALGGRVVTLLPRAAYDIGYVPASGVIGFAFESQHGTHAFASDVLHPFRTCPETLAWVPPGCEVRSCSASGGEYLTVRLAPGEETAVSRERRFNDRRDTRVRTLAHALRALLLRGHDDRSAFEEGVESLCERVAHLLGARPAENRTTTWMTAARLHRIDEWIDAHLGEGPSVPALARECGLSTGFLSRAMKAATGRSPHDYVVERRVARARAMLRDRSRSILDIALDCGFASHSHMSATFGRRLGVTPSALRRAGGFDRRPSRAIPISTAQPAGFRRSSRPPSPSSST